MPISSLLLTTALAITGPVPGEPARSEAHEPTVLRCQVLIDEEVQIPAQAAGVLNELAAREGDQLHKNDLVGKIMDDEPRLQQQIAQAGRRVADLQAANDIDLQFAKASAEVVEAEYRQALEANRRVRGTFPASEISRLKLSWKRAGLQIQRSELQQQLAALNADVSGFEVEVAESDIRRRSIRSPLDGIVVEVYKQPGEWVSPGEPIARVVRLDRLRVEGFLKADQYDPAAVSGRPLVVQVKLAGGRLLELPGTIAFVSPLVEANGEYRFWATVSNQQQNGHWQLRPGQTASVTIDLE